MVCVCFTQVQLARQHAALRAQRQLPHTAAAAAAAILHCFVTAGGESGAGKTETTKYLLQYLSSRSSGDGGGRANGSGGGGGAAVGVAEAVVQQNPVMEAFANAKTARNNNSSRFGKYIRVELGAEGGVLGGHVTTYLLEKIRVVQQVCLCCTSR
jgi:myosin heavy subunit